ncbi:MAG: DUF5067 domain-containing protein [Oscillospiraceae bacterium]|nr:hypothetical protein [Oscillospiraceae bacterium]MCR4758703.1 DUF5067 domain-containing protein [Oscillospiraceae bacterium]
MKKMRQSTSLLLAAALCCSAALSLTGCANNKNTSTPQNDGETVSYESAYTPEVPENPVAENVPGKEIKAEIGEELTYDNKLSIRLNQVIELDAVDKSQFRVLLAEMTIVNNSDKKIDCQTLTHFAATIDDKSDDNIVRDVTAGVLARKYYTKINSSLQSFNQEIAPGETANGYVHIYAPSTWNDMKLIYKPYKYYNNDQIVFNIDETKLTHYAEALN